MLVEDIVVRWFGDSMGGLSNNVVYYMISIHHNIFLQGTLDSRDCNRIPELDLYIEFKGALTSKPYSFTKRAWEVKNIKVINSSDIFSNEITIELQNNEVVKIPPVSMKRVGDMILSNTQFISDKLRFSIDAFRIEENLSKSVGLIYNSELKTTFESKLLKFFGIEQNFECSEGSVDEALIKNNLHSFLMKFYLTANMNRILFYIRNNRIGYYNDVLETPFSDGIVSSSHNKLLLYSVKGGYYYRHHIKPFKLVPNEHIMYNTLLAYKNILYTSGRIKNIIFKYRGNFDNNSIFHLDTQGSIHKSSLVSIGVETRFDIPASNIYIRRVVDKIVIFSYGYTLFTNTKVYNSGFNFDQSLKLLTNKHYVSITEPSKETTKWLVNSQFEEVFSDYVNGTIGSSDTTFPTPNSSYINRAFENLRVGVCEFIKRKNVLIDSSNTVYINNTNYGHRTNVDCYRPYKHKKYINYSTESSLYYGHTNGRKYMTNYTFHQPINFYHNVIGYNINIEGEFKLQFEDLSFKTNGSEDRAESFGVVDSKFEYRGRNDDCDASKSNLYSLYKKIDLSINLVYNNALISLKRDFFIIKSNINIYTSNPYLMNSSDESSYFIRNSANSNLDARDAIYKYMEQY